MVGKTRTIKKVIHSSELRSFQKFRHFFINKNFEGYLNCYTKIAF